MNSGRLLAIDHGTVRLGLAISDPERRIASPLTTYTRRSRDEDGRFLQQLVQEENVAEIVVGLPIHLDGHESEQSHAARKFARWLTELTNLPCILWDERFTTVEAESALQEAGLTSKRRKARRDRVAAQVLLQSYLDAGCPGERKLGALDE